MNRFKPLAAVLTLVFCEPVATASSGDLLDMPPTYEQFVAPVLTKAGCNSGACHGYRSGRGGFKLSLRGEDPEHDFHELVRELSGRRIDRIRPQNSLMLLKPTTQVPHEGGQRFSLDSREYKLLRRWIDAQLPAPNAGGPRLVRLDVRPTDRVLFAPQSDVQLSVTAHYDRGQPFDVTDLAVYETSNTLATVSRTGLVEPKQHGETTVMVRFSHLQKPVSLAFMPRREDFTWSSPRMSNYIDRHIFAKLKKLKINPAKNCSDHVFVRRAFVDALGLIPTADEARAFVADSAADKRARLIDELLHRPEFGEHWALKWSDVLRNEEKTLDSRGVEIFHAWIRDSFNNGKPLDQFARELLAARGSTYKVAPANFWRAQRDPLTRAETTARVFMGIRLQCAKCHNHPTGRWTQDDYYSWAGIFARIDYKIVKNNRKDKFDKHEFDGEQIVQIKDQGEVKNARTGGEAKPQFLGAATPAFAAEEDRLVPASRWVTNPKNLWFARAQVNRIWYHVMGRGLVEPIDDLRTTNPPTHPPLMDALAADFVARDYSVRHMIRTIMNSTAYQLDYESGQRETTDDANYSRAAVHRLTAEQLLDAQCQFLDVMPQFNGYPKGTRAGQLAGIHRVRTREKKPSMDERFLKQFGKPERLLACECERSNTTTLPHALTIISGEQIIDRLSAAGNRIDQLIGNGQSEEEIIDSLFWAAVSRPPSSQELDVTLKIVKELGGKEAFRDIAWALINSKEFSFRH